MSDPVRMNYSKPQSLDTQEGADDLGGMGFIVKQIDELNNQLVASTARRSPPLSPANSRSNPQTTTA